VTEIDDDTPMAMECEECGHVGTFRHGDLEEMYVEHVMDAHAPSVRFEPLEDE